MGQRLPHDLHSYFESYFGKKAIMTLTYPPSCLQFMSSDRGAIPSGACLATVSEARQY